MNKGAFWRKVYQEGGSFFTAVSKANETAYLILISLYVALYLILKVAWTEKVETLEGVIQYSVLSIVIWGAAIYLLYVIIIWKDLWKNTLAIVLIGVPVLVAVYFFSQKMSTNLFGAVMDVFFCLMACGKKYRKILRCILGTVTGFLLIAWIGVIVGFTNDVIKPDNIHPGHSLGIEYPNNWGYLVFLALILIWYIYLRYKPVLTFAVFWTTSAFMIFYVYCRTISFFSLAFPVFAYLIDWLEEWVDKKYVTRIDNQAGEEILDLDHTEKKRKLNPFGWIAISIPLLAFAFMLFTSMQYEWVHNHLYYTWFHNFAMRFVEGGLYFKTYGFPLIGNPYKSNVYTFMNVNGDFLQVGILDSSFAAYMIMRGMIWMTYTLLWLCLAHWKAVKKRDYAIIIISSFLLFFAMLERPGLEGWYNFVLLYPLAKVESKLGTDPVLEFTGKETDSAEGDGSKTKSDL